MRTEERRKKSRKRLNAAVHVSFVDEQDRFRTITGRTVDESEGGLGLILPCALPVGSSVRIQMPQNAGSSAGACDAFVRWCRRHITGEFLLGVITESCASAASSSGGSAATPVDEDLYEIMQVHMNADPETIHRVFRILAARYHPDNSETGDASRFRKLMSAYEVLSDPQRRASFDVWHGQNCRRQWRIFDSASVTTGREGEKRKRAALLLALYTQRISDPDRPSLNLRDMENLLGCPREHLEFALWYLKEGGYISRTDDSKFQITLKGVDLAESYADQAPVPLQLASG